MSSFFDAFFFSVETLATVGYGHMYPETLYGHLIAMLEIMVGMFGLAVITGLIFVRFSRPTARMHFSKVAVIAPFDGVPTLMIRGQSTTPSYGRARVSYGFTSEYCHRGRRRYAPL